ncbi:peptide/nickel transport system permease protein [Shimia gijangensis]|uniref:Peptide/nickel transport system permease protein n=1 Tax=Shimia gijangensis TaxID=1470563 RepID=A0A1M6N1X4_9RHOB|nr:ABC transporter permease [Shimia gijangensis]SHJ89662.1 peptide/nickel transport system permease protein [Shimia gijangensis]
MTSLILKRIGIGMITALAVSIIIFFGTKILPGDAAQIRLGQEATEANMAAMRERMGLDKSYVMQYVTWLGNFLSGNLGISLASDVPITDLIADRYQNTVYVSVLTSIVAVPVSLALGILAAMFPGSYYDRILTLVSVTLVAAPEFFTATLLVLLFVFALDLGNAVVVGSPDGKGLFSMYAHFALPIATLSFVIASQLIRMSRAAVLNVMSSPYIEMAILKGVPRRRIILRHALLNAIGPIVNVVALNLAYLVTGVVVVEVYFGYPGLATLIVQGVQTRDFVLVQGLGMIFCLTYVILMLAADVASFASNPRLRHPK